MWLVRDSFVRFDPTAAVLQPHKMADLTQGSMAPLAVATVPTCNVNGREFTVP